MSASDNPLKRKFEEYHDPDYPRPTTEIKKHKHSPSKPLNAEEKAVKLKSIIKREFQEELNRKEAELNAIEHRLAQSKRLLQRIRYAIVSSFYSKRKLEFSEQMLQDEALQSLNNGNQQILSTLTSEQKSIHPSLKKLLGKKPIDYSEILKIRPPRQAATTAKSSLSEKLRSKKEERKKLSINSAALVWRTEENTIKPRYVEPIKVERTIDKLNTPRGRFQTSHLIAVGNTSKYVGDEKCDQEGVTHKWLIYVKMKTNIIAVEDIVSKARFYLHPSFKPNDVVEVDSPPFQISRRGWGEFPVRVQLYFHSHINQKPLQIIHNLVLDKKRTGMQTIGAETVVELWLKIPVENIQSNIQPDSYAIIEDSKPYALHKNPLMLHMDHSEHDMLLNDKTTNSNGYIDSENVKDINLKQENVQIQAGSENIKIEKEIHIEPVLAEAAPIKPPPVSENVHKSSTVTAVKPVTQLRPGKLVKCLDTKGNIIMVELRVDPKNPKNIQIIRTGNPAVAPLNKTTPLNRLTPTPPGTQVPHIQNGIPSISNKPLVQLPNKQSNTTMIKIAKPKQESLLKPQISLLKPQLFKSTTPQISKNQTSSLTTPITVPIASLNQSVLLKRPVLTKPTKRLQLKQVFMRKNHDLPRNYRKELNIVFFERSRFHSIRSAVEFLLKKIPIINPKIANDEKNYVQHFPFSVNSVTVFNRLPKVKQNFLQWYQAKCINRMISKHLDLLETPKWTTREIVIFAQQFGYMQLEPSNYLAHYPLRTFGVRSSAKDTIQMSENKNTISKSSQICDWIDDWYGTMNFEAIRSTRKISEIIEIDVENDDVKCETSVKHNTAFNMGIPMDSDLQKECTWIADACTNIEINIKQEDNTIYSSVPLMLHRITRNFVEDLIRRAYGVKFNKCSEVTNNEITIDDLQAAVYDVPKFDFLSKKYMATNLNDSSKQ